MNRLNDGAEYEDVQFNKLHFDGQRCDGSHFSDCTFRNCSLRESRFQDCRFSDCTFHECDLSLLALSGAAFQNVTFSESRIIGVNWAAATWPRFVLDAPIRFKACVLDLSTFIGLRLHNIGLTDCVANDVDFSEADLTAADFANARLDGSRFRRTNLTRANFVGATGYTIDPTANIIAKARFSLPEALSLLYSLDIELVD